MRVEMRGSMEKRELTEKFYSAFHIPVTVRKEEKAVLIYGGEDDILYKFYQWIHGQIKRGGHRITIVVTSYHMYGAFLTLDDGVEVLAGPVHGSEIREDRLRKLCQELELSGEIRNRTLRWLGALPVMSAENFSAAVTFLYYSITGENAQVFWVECESPRRPSIDLSQVAPEEGGIFDEKRDHILAYIEQGDVEGLNQILGGWYMLDEKQFPVFADSRMKSMQISLAAMILYGGQAAVRGGVAEDLVLSQNLLDYERLFSFRNGREFMQYFKEIAMEYARMVRDGRNINLESALVRKIDHVIQEHLWDKLTPTLIAEELEMNLSYLCREFKKNTGKTIGEYINERKISEAKRLLRATDQSLVEISDTLGFSSQSYFHRVFKKMTGVTPTEYREQ